ncbi:MAG: helix-turn-helix transcriptional regulator [Kiritimatiellae bacterium]|nr:helix-turn-helix transcriptional regulator [Kiritimatiellia bacterium]
MGTKFAENLRAARIKERRTASQCAEAIGCTVAAWSQWESGKREPKFELLLDICLMLNTTPNVLLGFEAPPPLRASAPPHETKIRTGDNSPVVIGGVSVVGNHNNVTPPKSSSSSTTRRKRTKK